MVNGKMAAMALYFFWPFGFIDRTVEDMTGNRSRERGVTSSKGPKARIRSQGCCNEGKAPAHGTPAPSTRPNSAPWLGIFVMTLALKMIRAPTCTTVPSRSLLLKSEPVINLSHIIQTINDLIYFT